MHRVLMPLLAMSGCSLTIDDGPVDCDAMAAASVQLEVVDPNGVTLTNATAWFQADGATQDCDGFGSAEGTWVCGWEISGPMTVFADAPGYFEGSVQVDVAEGVCHVQTQQVRLELQEVFCPPVELWGVEVTTLNEDGERIQAQVEWLPLDGTDFTNPEPCEDWGDGMYACAPNTGGEVEIWASSREFGSFYTVVDVPMDDCGPITQSITAVVDRNPN